METEAETTGSRQEGLSPNHSAGNGKDARRDGETVAPTTTLKQPSGDCCSIYGCFVIHCVEVLVFYQCPTSRLRWTLTLF